MKGSKSGRRHPALLQGHLVPIAVNIFDLRSANFLLREIGLIPMLILAMRLDGNTG